MNIIKENKFYIIMFFILTGLFCLFSLSGDDLGWATSSGAELLKKGFDGYNGRYLGNLCLYFTLSVYPFL